MATPYRIVRVRNGSEKVYTHCTSKGIADAIAEACNLLADQGTTYRVEPVEKVVTAE